jgi:ketosteroid isomerase-like protein
MTGLARKTRRARSWWIGPALAVLAMAGGPLAAASGVGDSRHAGVRVAASEDPIVADTRKLIDRSVELWNEHKLDEMVAGQYTEDTLMLPPNHEPIRGRAAILAYLKPLRALIGEYDQGDHLIQATPAGDNSVSWAGQYSFHDGLDRITSHELYVRQSDGSMKCAVEMFGSRDPLK